MSEEIITVIGKNFNCRFDIEHTKKIINILIGEFNKDRCNDVELMEIIAGLSFVILGDFECGLEENSSIKEDREKTLENIDKLNTYLFGGYYE